MTWFVLTTLVPGAPMSRQIAVFNDPAESVLGTSFASLRSRVRERRGGRAWCVKSSSALPYSSFSNPSYKSDLDSALRRQCRVKECVVALGADVEQDHTRLLAF